MVLTSSNQQALRPGHAIGVQVAARILCIAGTAAALAVAGCASSTTSGPAPASPAPQSPPTTESPAPQAIQNLAANAAVRQDLLTAFTAFRSDSANTPGFAAIPPSAVAGISPGLLYYAFDPATNDL
jgi:hypothetical protein